MNALLSARIVRWPFKLLYAVVVWYGLRFAIDKAVLAFHVEAVASAVIETVVSLAVILLATRIFRGRGEEIAPPRPLWRMTATSGWSIGLGVLLSLSVLLSAFNLVLALTGVVAAALQDDAWTVSVEGLVAVAVEMLGLVILVVLFFRSAVGLRRLEAAAIPPAPAFAWHGHPLELAGPTTRVLVEESTATAAGADGRRGLLTPSTSKKRLEVLVDGRRIGALPDNSVEIRDLVLRAGGPVSVELVRTGDPLWAEVPTDALVEAALAVEPSPAR